MAKQTINVGTVANDATGDTLRAAGQKINANFTELYPRTVPTTSLGASGDVTGMVAFDSTYSYYCIADYDGTTNIWKRSTHPAGTW